MARTQGDLETARTHAQAALTAYRPMGNAWNTALALWDLGRAERDAGQSSLAQDYYQEALALLKRIGAPSAATVQAELQALETA